jgi:hypothetical protein
MMIVVLVRGVMPMFVLSASGPAMKLGEQTKNCRVVVVHRRRQLNRGKTLPRQHQDQQN